MSVMSIDGCAAVCRRWRSVQGLSNCAKREMRRETGGCNVGHGVVVEQFCRRRPTVMPSMVKAGMVSVLSDTIESNRRWWAFDVSVVTVLECESFLSVVRSGEVNSERSDMGSELKRKS